MATANKRASGHLPAGRQPFPYPITEELLVTLEKRLRRIPSQKLPSQCCCFLLPHKIRRQCRRQPIARQANFRL